MTSTHLTPDQLRHAARMLRDNMTEQGYVSASAKQHISRELRREPTDVWDIIDGLNAMADEMEPAWYAEYHSGYCTVVRAIDLHMAREKAGNGTRVPNDKIRLLHRATEDEVTDFVGSGGTIR